MSSLPTSATPSAPLPGPSLRSILAALRPSRRAVDLALGAAALCAGLAIVAGAAYTAADAVLPLALLAGVARGAGERMAPSASGPGPERRRR